MSVTLRLRKTDFVLQVNTTLANQQASGPSPHAYWIKKALVAAGWTVYYTCDGVNMNTNDLWATPAFQAVLLQLNAVAANSTGTIDAVWCCLRSPTVDANGDYLHICLSPSLAQWSNPLIRGLNNASSTYGNTVGNGAPYVWVNGATNGFIRIGMTLSPNLTEFAGGAPFIATNSTTAMGTLPTPTSPVIWTTHNLGNGLAAGIFTSLTVLTDGNQFHVIQDTGLNTVGYRNWWSVCSLVNGGYAVIEQGVGHTAAAVGTSRGVALLGGRRWNNILVNTIAADTPTELGGWRTAYVKRDTTIVTGGLACPEPPGWEAAVDSAFYNTASQFPNVLRLRGISCTYSTHYDLGSFSDFVLMGNTRINDNDRIVDTTAHDTWFSYKDLNAYMLKWDWLDNPVNRTVLIPA